MEEKAKAHGEEEKSEVQKKQWAEKVSAKDCKLPFGEEERRRGRKERQKERQTTQNETSLGEVWKIALSPCASGTELALCQRCSRRVAEKDGDDEKVAAAASSSDMEQMGGGDSQRWRQPKGEDKTKMKKEGKLLRCTLLNGSAWSTERKCMRRYKGKCDIFFGNEHRLRKEEMEEQFNREAKEGWRFAASAARITDEMAGEGRKHTSGGVFCCSRQ